MKTIKKFTSWILVAAMLCSPFAPVASVRAEGTTETATTTESLENATTESTTTEAATTETVMTEAGTTESVTTEAGATESTENATTEEGQDATTEQPAEESNLVPTELSPKEAQVVVLDPGHCRKHTGATANGLKEELVVWDIAEACQDALNDYGDVTVYMTRGDEDCCASLGLGDCLIARNNYAKKLDADFLVSLHINAGGAASGANVLAAYASGYRDNIRKETQEFGKIALTKLKAIGIRNRGLLLRKSGSGNRYSNGSLADYYSIVRNGVLQNIPSVIIEHGFITSTSDCSKFFRTVAKRKKVGKADAKAIIDYYDLCEKITFGEFVEEEGATYYQYSDGKRAAGWVKDDGKWYYFNETTGKMATGFITVDDEKYYLQPSTGEMQVGWIKLKSGRYFAKGNGSIVRSQIYNDTTGTYLFNSSGKQLGKGLHSVEDDTYYVNSKKKVVTGIATVNGKTYAFSTASGKMLYGYQNVNGKYYYLDSNTGVMIKKKIVSVKGNKYYFGASGQRQGGLVKYNKKQYYFSTTNGKMLKGWRKINNKYYYFDKKTGAMQKNKWIGNYYVNSKGVRTKKK